MYDSGFISDINRLIIAHLQIHLWKHGSAVGTVATKPYAMGHECAGEIISVGMDSTGWNVGDRVAIKPGAPCFM
jgi:L-iditol 2-dehydrogenase